MLRNKLEALMPAVLDRAFADGQACSKPDLKSDFR